MNNTPRIKGSDYEHLVNKLIAGLREGANLTNFEQRYGATNRIKGASGYKHQIDVSLLGHSDLFLFEAKCLKRVLGVQEVLIMGARLTDISAAFPNHRVHASVISMKHVSRNAQPIADHFNVKIDWISDVKNYGITFANQHLVGWEETVGFKCTIECKEIPPQ
ncbi:hypothetical protein [Hydrogenophaga electricum]|uniref:hypothetical protein n=1 Tax=Hydrogenophaga electricum TaxID=1230953 RepID=UPI0024E0421E|nr:hypothetical protein [Hydrogenophaga electricum]